ncbi:zinc finger protein 653 [Amia ocellicauda]|uniref:zinc finger protein 653 n=1 Tax=Amia ocellicauda TaxID=2972642 RepID=UPI003464A55C
MLSRAVVLADPHTLHSFSQFFCARNVFPVRSQRTSILFPVRSGEKKKKRKKRKQHTAVVKMAEISAEEETTLDREPVDQISAILRRCRGRPRLTDTDRAKRRLESRKKYDVRRVYLGESHRLWSELRRRTGLSDAALAEYLILLDSIYGERYQHKYAGKKLTAEFCIKPKRGRKCNVNCLSSLVSWYEEHRQSCPHEPHLHSLEPVLGFSTTAVWQCQAGHGFLQHLVSPSKDASESENENENEPESELDLSPGARETHCTRRKAAVATRRRQEVMETVQESEAVSSGHCEPAVPEPGLTLPGQDAKEGQADAPDQAEAQSPSRPLWDMEVVLEEEHALEGDKGDGSSAATENGEGTTGPLNEEVVEQHEQQPQQQQQQQQQQEAQEEETGAVVTPEMDYGCVVVTAALTDRLDKTDPTAEPDCPSPVPPHTPPPSTTPTPTTPPPTTTTTTTTTMHISSGGELFEQQTLQTVVASCQIPDAGGHIEGSQVIIITGPGYEALTSEGIHLNVGEGVGNEMTCTVIEGVAYNQVCDSDGGHRGGLRPEDGIRAVHNKQMVHTSLEEGSPGDPSEEKKGHSSMHRSKRSRRGPVIEADGMLKMFHCPYEGCSQVYVAISSFQNHVNLVHRKGRTKVCPHPGCGKKFYLSNHLHRHMIIHSGVRDFICETCGKSFKRKNHLEVHRRTHTGETPLQCEICGYQCRQRASLNWHMKKHTPEVQYNFTCEHCGKRFEKLESVKFHKLKSHPEKQAA